MAEASCRLKHARRTKRKNSQLNRALQTTQLEQIKNFSMLLTVLHASNNEATITKADVDYVQENLKRLSWDLQPSQTATGEWIIRLVEGPGIVVPKPNHGGVSQVVMTPAEESTEAHDSPIVAPEDHDHSDDISRMADEGCPHA